MSNPNNLQFISKFENSVKCSDSEAETNLPEPRFEIEEEVAVDGSSYVFMVKERKWYPFEKEWRYGMLAKSSSSCYHTTQLWRGEDEGIHKLYGQDGELRYVCQDPPTEPRKPVQMLDKYLREGENNLEDVVERIVQESSEQSCSCPHLFLDGHQSGCSYWEPVLIKSVWGIPQPEPEPDYLTPSDKGTFSIDWRILDEL